MAKIIKTKALCSGCCEYITKEAATKHINKCFISKKTTEKNSCYIIKVEYAWKKIYWMYIAVPLSGTLESLDQFLRTTWLECCQHLSEFIIDETYYHSYYDELETSFLLAPKKVTNMDKLIKNVLMPGKKFIHKYDFASTTELTLQVIDATAFDIVDEIIILMRNNAPEFSCFSCKYSAIQICVFCHECFCDNCFDHNNCEDAWTESSLPLVNSPRTGVCGYTGSED